MSTSRLIASIVALGLASSWCGCSISLVTARDSLHDQCTSSYLLPIIDTGIVAGSVATIAGASKAFEAGAQLRTVEALVFASVVGGTLALASSIYGFYTVRSCRRDAKTPVAQRSSPYDQQQLVRGQAAKRTSNPIVAQAP